MGILKSIIEKIKLNELAVIALIASLILTLLSEKQIERLGLTGILQYQMYISLCLIITSSYFMMIVIFKIIKFFRNKFFGFDKIGKNYMKTYMSPEEMGLLISVFYDSINKSFRTSGLIEYNDGLKAGLEAKHIIYRSSSLSTFGTEFSYNLQPYAREFLNKNLRNGNITIRGDSFEYKLQ